LHANIIYRFTKYVNWPEQRRSGDFIIGVVGDTPLYEELESFIENKKVGLQRIVIKRFSASSDFSNCHILFISDDEKRSLKKIAARTAGFAMLIVSESDDFAEKGACINFVLVDDHLKLEINKNNIESRNMRIASELIQLGKIVK
jgi:hypothetical protein